MRKYGSVKPPIRTFFSQLIGKLTENYEETPFSHSLLTGKFHENYQSFVFVSNDFGNDLEN